MKQLVILSGKGGTGKTSLAAAFAHLFSQSPFANRVVLADADVDAANLELVLQPRLREQEDFRGGQVAVIDESTCTSCGDCEAVCRFDAIHHTDSLYAVDPIACDGCAACVYQCPSESITMFEQVAGRFYVSDSRYGPLYHASLYPGRENSGKLVTLVKQRARLRALDEHRELVIVDGPPGIGCPVIAAASGADLALIVAEPTAAGVHDMKRILQTTEHFHIPALVCINKADIYPLGTKKIEAYCWDNEFQVAGKIPFDEAVTEAMVHGEPVTAYKPNAPVSRAIIDLWCSVMESLSIQNTCMGL
ncbi:MAG: ATP-binding protein [Anaerolineales bacterium]|nr:ATP-binding protein [Anaerolineales bacterium]